MSDSFNQTKTSKRFRNTLTDIPEEVSPHNSTEGEGDLPEMFEIRE